MTKPDSVVVLRCQLPEKNDFHRLDPSLPLPAPPETDLDEMKCPALCQVCGHRAPLRCSKCGVVSYCSKSHQRIHWSKEHKRKCQSNSPAGPSSIGHNRCYPCIFERFDVVIDAEDEVECPGKQDPKEDPEDTEGHQITQGLKTLNLQTDISGTSLNFGESVDTEGAPDCEEKADEALTQSDLNGITGAAHMGTDDETTLAFHIASSSHPDQCIRYARTKSETCSESAILW
eukprot:CAMPEP_0185753100 /NCGR_PEP_ID=MMETSP1174-20130828/11844_1 /TAXON_ID=35687 /ORGANISM="Dictyocha speculum, Strain CCMP1381" /LENGTH=230 /DNA_ID=CAMNT_0028430807 /DNA_START=294 /DNA_END=983 /DNA_ORIENTATION=+